MSDCDGAVAKMPGWVQFSATPFAPTKIVPVSVNVCRIDDPAAQKREGCGHLAIVDRPVVGKLQLDLIVASGGRKYDRL
jgi:hypothetical protein